MMSLSQHQTQRMLNIVTSMLTTLFVLCFVLLMFVQQGDCELATAAQFRCYTCEYKAGDRNTSCVVAPERGKFEVCSEEYCTIMRQELRRPAGTISFFKRSCEIPIYRNKVLHDETYITYYRSCTTDLCNKSDGLSSAMDPNYGTGENTVVKGKNAAMRGATIGVTLLCFVTGLNLI